jgi:acyl dehydratase
MREPKGPFGHRTVTADAVARFGELTGDYARIHHDQHLGRATPAGRGFAHGLLSAAWALGAATRHAPERMGCGDERASTRSYVGAFACRFSAITHFDDTLGFELGATAHERHEGFALAKSPFACTTQAGLEVTSGSIGLIELGADTAPIAWPHTPAPLPPADDARPPEVWSGEDIVAFAPRGLSPGRTIGEADVASWVQSTGDVTPLYSHAGLAAEHAFEGRVVPPMLCFCVGFAVWLRTLLALPLAGDASTAGHLGDRFWHVAPVRIGDTLDVRHAPLSIRRTRSDPTRGVATFGLELVDQHGAPVQHAEVDVMVPMRTP